MTSALDPDEGVIQLAVLAAAAAMLIVSLAAPTAFGSGGVIFSVAYLLVGAIHLVLLAIAGRGDRSALTALGRIAAVCASLIVYEVVRHREARRWIRSRRGAFSTEEASRVESSRRRGRTPRARWPT